MRVYMSGLVKKKGPVYRDTYFYLLLLLFILFFVGGPDYYGSRHFKALWNWGHIFFFALLPFYVFGYRKWRPANYIGQGIITICSSIIIGTLVEYLQYSFQRTPDIDDTFRNLIGGLIGLFFLVPQRKRLEKRKLLAFQIVTIILVGGQIYPVFVAFTDEYIARKQFPILSDFETPWELQRWSGENAVYAVDDSIYCEGRHALRVQLNIDAYSGVYLFYFPRDWKTAKNLSFCIYNPLVQDLEIVCRVNDSQHAQTGYLYEDRFNRSYFLSQGWHHIKIDMTDVRDAPKNRSMDLEQIVRVGIFTSHLIQPRIVYIDNVRLEK